MSITLRNLTVGRSAESGGKTYWSVDAHSADVTGLETVKAEPSSGDLYLTHLSIECPSMAVGEWFKVQDDDTLMMHLLGDMGGGLVYSRDWSEERAPKITGALKVDQEAADPVHIAVEGFTA